MPKKKQTRTAHVPVPTKFHIDKRASDIAATAGDDDDELLSTREMAAWLKVSEQWLEVRRVNGDGPPYERLGPRLVRYRRGAAREWLNQRTYQHTKEYAT